MKTLKFQLLFLVLILTIGCSSKQQIVNTISDVMHQFNSGHKEVVATLEQLHDNGIVTGEKWNNVVDIRRKVGVVSEKLNENWKLVPQTASAIENFILTKDFQDALVLIFQLAEVANRNDIIVNLSVYEREGE